MKRRSVLYLGLDHEVMRVRHTNGHSIDSQRLPVNVPHGEPFGSHTKPVERSEPNINVPFGGTVLAFDSFQPIADEDRVGVRYSK